MNDRSARKITNALDRQPGLVMMTGKLGGVELRIFGRPDLKHLERDYGAREVDAALATQRALGIAMVHQLAVVIQFRPTVGTMQ